MDAGTLGKLKCFKTMATSILTTPSKFRIPFLRIFHMRHIKQLKLKNIHDKAVSLPPSISSQSVCHSLLSKDVLVTSTSAWCSHKHRFLTTINVAIFTSSLPQMRVMSLEIQSCYLIMRIFNAHQYLQNNFIKQQQQQQPQFIVVYTFFHNFKYS